MKKMLLCLILLLVGCTHNITTTDWGGNDWYVINGQPLEPKQNYKVQYEMAEECLGMRGTYNNIIWQKADYIHREGYADVAGLWVWPNRIIIKTGFEDNPVVLRHESVHHILQMPGHPGFAFPYCVVWHQFPTDSLPPINGWQTAVLTVAPIALGVTAFGVSGNFETIDDFFDSIEHNLMGRGWIEHGMVSVAGSSLAAVVAGEKGYALASWTIAAGYIVRESVELQSTHSWSDFAGDLTGPLLNAAFGLKLVM